MRVNEIYTKQLFGDCGTGFGFQIQEVSDHWIIIDFLVLFDSFSFAL